MTLNKKILIVMPLLLAASYACINLIKDNKNRKEERTMKKESKEATFIKIAAKKGKREQLANLLSSAGTLVKSTEPETLEWMALSDDQSKDTFYIIDFFADENGRKKHFAGQVAAALKENSPELVEGAWEKGVVSNVQNSQVLSSLTRNITSNKAKLATHITVRAKKGQEENLAEFLKSGASLVEKTEPMTLLWYALRIDHSTFVIYDVFESSEGRNEHFNGQVAAALKAKSNELVEGGWENGVLTHITHSSILSSAF